MKINRRLPLSAIQIILLSCVLFPQAYAQVSVTTYRNDNSRSGVNSQETLLSPVNVNGSQFGKLFSQSVDGNVFGQPLYVPNLAISGQGTHNVVFVATENDSVYAFDADTNQSALWSKSLIDSTHGGFPNEVPMNTVPNTDTGFSDVTNVGYAAVVYGIMGPTVGITSTPVIDLNSKRMYVVTKSKYPNIPTNQCINSQSQCTFVQRLHALDITTGLDAVPPVVIQPPSGWQGVPFDPLFHLNRSALLLANGTVYVTFASHGDWSQPPKTWYGWMFAYDASTLTQKANWVATPGGINAGIWMSGAGPAVDANGNIFLATGNGSFDNVAALGTQFFQGDFGTSILKLALAPNTTGSNGSGLQAVDYFTPYNEGNLGAPATDLDLGAGGVLLLPDQAGSAAHPHLLVLAGKNGTIYLVDRDNMGQFCSACTTTDTNIVQEIQGALTGNLSQYVGVEFYGMPVYLNGNVYFWGLNQPLQEFSLSNGLLSGTPVKTASDLYPATGGSDPRGANLSVSSNGNTNGIIWSVSSEAPAVLSGSAVLRAHDASNLNELYSSDVKPSDDAGPPVKFAVPTVANGKVYVGAQKQFTVYGLLSSVDAAQFLSQSVPSTMMSGLYYHATLNFKNTGTSTWDTTNYWLESENPLGNTTWGMSQVPVPTTMYPGYFPTFRFVVRAPTGAPPNFQWRMQHGSMLFGDTTPNVLVNIVQPPPYYQGCWVDSTSRALPNLLSSGGETVESCKLKAANAGWYFAGLQNGGQCFAGNNLGLSPAAEDECNIPCTANSSETCGGTFRNSIWSTVQIDVSWVKPSSVSYGPANTLTVQGDALRGTGTVQMLWQDVTANGPWNTVAAQSTPSNNIWANTIPSSNYCHSYNVKAIYSGVTSSTFSYNGLTSGYCNETGYIAWIQPQSTAGFGPPGSLAVAGNATGGPAGATVSLWWSDITAGTGWNQVSNAATPNSSGTWFGSIPNVNYSHQYSVYAVYDAFSTQPTQGACTYQGNGAIMYCPH